MRYLFLALLSCFCAMPSFAQKQGQARIDSLIQELPKAKEDTNKVNLLNTISFAYYAYDPIAGIKYGADGLALAEKLQWKRGISNAYNSLGTNYHIQSKLDTAVTYYLKALKLVEELGDKKRIAKITGNIGMLYYVQSDYPRALDHLFRVLKIFEELKDKESIAVQLGNIGNIYEEQKMYDKALEYDILAMQQYRALGKKDEEAVLTGNIGNVYVEMEKYDSALKYNEASLYMMKQLGNKEGIGRNLLNLGIIYNKQKEHYRALEYLFESLQIHKEFNSMKGIAMSDVNIAEAFHKIAQDPSPMKPNIHVPPTKAACLKLAADHAAKAIAIHKQTNNLSGLSYAYNVLAEVQMASRNYKDAIESFLQYSKYKDSVFSIENNKKITNLEHQRELYLKESKIKILTQDNELKTLSAEKDKLTNRALVSGIVMMVIIAFSVLMYFVRKQRTEKLIANERVNTLLKDQELKSVSNMLEVQEQERKRIAADLHDRLGSMLSTVKLYFNSVEQQIDSLKEQNRDQYHKATSLLDEACEEVRKISHNLVSGELVKFGLVSALHQLRATIMETGSLKVDVLAFGMEERLDSATEISLYRVIQELMNNILKHAKASVVTIQLNKVENSLNIVVEDNGVGYDVEAALAKEGMGLKNMETRVRKLRGTIEFDSVKGRGATTVIDIPV